MRKLLLLAGIFTVLAYNAQARYYEENGYYYRKQPRYEQREARYREEPRYTRQEPQYHRISREEERYYNERRYIENNQNTIRPYIGVDAVASNLNMGNGSKEWPMKDGGYEYFEDNYKAASFVAGMRINKNLGIEAFYQ